MRQARDVIDKVRTSMRGKWGAWWDRAILAIVTYGIWWVIQSVGTLLTQQAVMNEKVSDMQVQLSGTVSVADARRDYEEGKRRDEQQDRLLIDLDKRVSTIERRLP